MEMPSPILRRAPRRQRRRRGRATASSCSLSSREHLLLTIGGVNSSAMRIVAWNCNMALDRKVDVLLDLAPDIAIVCECAEPERLRLRSKSSWMQSEPVWIGRNPHKGLAVFAFNGYVVRLAESYHPSLRYIAPVHVGGPTQCNLLAVWAHNASAGSIRKHQLCPLRPAPSP